MLTDILCAYCVEEGWYIYCIEHGAMNAVKSKPILMTICWRFMPLLNSLKLWPTNSLWRHHLLGFRVLLRFSYIYWYAFKWCGCMINKMAWFLILLFSPSFTLIFCKMWYSFFWKNLDHETLVEVHVVGVLHCVNLDCWKPIEDCVVCWRLSCMLLKTALYAEDWVVCC